MPNDNDNKRKYGDNNAPGGGRIDLSKVDPRRVDDFRERIRRKEEEKNKISLVVKVVAKVVSNSKFMVI